MAVNVNVMYVSPNETPVTTPVDGFTEAIVGSALLHVPLPDVSLTVALVPLQVPELPVIGASALTVTVAVVMQPSILYVIVELPPLTPVTVPVAKLTVAIAGLLLVQLPPPASVNGVVKPLHTTVVPEMAPGIGLTLKVAVLPVDIEAEQPDAFVTDNIVTVVLPDDVRVAVLKLPEPLLIVTDVVRGEEVVAPLNP